MFLFVVWFHVGKGTGPCTLPPVTPRRQYRRKPPKAEIIKALEESGGVLTSAARRLGVHRQRRHEWLANDPILQAARAEALDVLLDLAEDAVVAGIRGLSQSLKMVVEGAQQGCLSQRPYEESPA